MKTLGHNNFSIELFLVFKEEIILFLNKLPENKKREHDPNFSMRPV